MKLLIRVHSGRRRPRDRLLFTTVCSFITSCLARSLTVRKRSKKWFGNDNRSVLRPPIRYLSTSETDVFGSTWRHLLNLQSERLMFGTRKRDDGLPPVDDANEERNVILRLYETQYLPVAMLKECGNCSLLFSPSMLFTRKQYDWQRKAKSEASNWNR